MAALSSLGNAFSCRPGSGFAISDWRGVACHEMRQSIHLTDDAVHYMYTTDSSARFARMTRHAADATANVRACSSEPATAVDEPAITTSTALVRGMGPTQTSALCECERCDQFYLVLP